MHKRLTTYILPADGDSCGYRKPSFPLEVYEKIDFLISVNSSCSDYGLTHTLNLGHTMEDYLWYETTPTLSNKLFLSYILIEWGGFHSCWCVWMGLCTLTLRQWFNQSSGKLFSYRMQGKNRWSQHCKNS